MRIAKSRFSPLAVVVCCQAILLFMRLNLLPIWTDELFTLRVIALPFSGIITAVQHDIHPPLYYLLLNQWMRLPLPWTGLDAARAFSACWALIATALFDVFWLRNWRPAHRWAGLALFGFSPILMLYGRMARSYAMQTALALLTISLLWRWLRNPRAGWRCPAAAFVSATLLLYTHYLPGMAILLGFALVSLRRIGLLPLAAFGTATAIAYAPWLRTLAVALRDWQRAAAFQSHYTLSGSQLIEQGLKIVVMLVSLTIGETFLAISLLLVPLILLVIWLGVRVRPPGASFTAFIASAAVIGFLGATRWVGWPFITARLLWLLPFLVMALVAGLSRLRRPVRLTVVALVFMSFASSTALYFRRQGFLNLGYAAPTRDIANRLRQEAAPADLILVDGYNADGGAVQFHLGPTVPLHFLTIRTDNAPQLEGLARAARQVWVIRNTHDVSPGHVVSSVEATVCAGRRRASAFYQPYTDWQRFASRLVSSTAPQYFYEMTVCR